jgi:hypothetical protein
MALSDRIEQERQALLAQRQQEQAALDQRRAESERMMSELEDRIEALLTGLSRDAVRKLARMGSPTATIEVADLRGNAPRSRKSYGGPPQIRLQAGSHGNGTWTLRADYQSVPYGVMERPEDGERLGKKTLSTSSLAEAVAWLELKLARGIALVQLWQSEHPTSPALPDVPRSESGDESGAASASTNASEGKPTFAKVFAEEARNRSPLGWIIWFIILMTAIAYVDR